MSVLNTMIQQRAEYHDSYRSKSRHRRILTAFNYIVLIAAGTIVYSNYSEIVEFLSAFIKTLQ